MSDAPQRFPDLRRLAVAGRVLAILGIGGLLLAAIFGLVSGQRVWPWVGLHLESFAVGFVALLAAAVCVFLWIAVALLLKIEAHAFRSYDVSRDMADHLEKQSHELKTVAENTLLSDMVRAVTHRSRERTAIRLAINEEIIRGDWEAAYSLVELLESRYGYRNEAARIRQELDESRAREFNTRVHDTVEQIRALMGAHDWDRARRMMDRLMSSHPENDEVKALPQAFHRAWNEHKRRLLKEWDQAVQRNDVDGGIALLKELDHYLTPNEAAALQESARGVFRTKLHNLGVQFSLAVSESNWSEALRVGRQIQDEFPNTRMASEVRERIHVLAKRAGDVEAGTASQDAVSI